MVKAKCRYFGKCGGCSYQDIPYQEQVSQKKKRLKEATGISDPLVLTGQPYGYRNRMDMIFTGKGIGFRLKGTWDTPVDVECCSISNDMLNQLITEVREYFQGADAFDIRNKTGTFKYAVIRTPSEKSSITFILNRDSDSLQDARKMVLGFSKASSADNIFIGIVPRKSDVSVTSDIRAVKGTEFLKEVLLGKPFKFNSQGFFQNNSMMAKMIHEHVNSLLKCNDTKDATLLDLYGGVGTFGIINSSGFKKTVIAEGDPEAVLCAKKNIEENNIANAEAIKIKDKQIDDLEIDGKLAVIADPPRVGLHKNVVRWLNERAPETLIYVSCNPKQLGNDLEQLKGFKVKSCALLDMFPQTPHFETVAELERL